ncbi:very long-chain specific acyl-CoA dehydrogenase, mitochondrial-like isoform X2 [Gordionus sp. m RMFG-2023]|uniref:very long-chain specific acyl-CoA dehydrogenase, mitochondrial-like isoform X2 n=1 Tax=Gordionus sp. m RMFG-2023 TaxID=3053472 RepID=UPI0031FD366B
MQNVFFKNYSLHGQIKYWIKSYEYSTKSKEKQFRESKSFIKNLFRGKIVTDQIYPYPQILNEDQKDTLKMLIDPTTKFLTEVNNPALNDEKCEISEKVMHGLKDMGAFGLQIPTKYGGLGLNNTQYARMVECVGRGMDMGLGITLGAHQSIGKAYKLNGTKLWISNAGFAEIFTVFARLKDPSNAANVKKGAESKNDYDDIRAFIVERKFGGVTSGPPEKKMGIRGSNTAELVFNDTLVPEANLLGQTTGAQNPINGFKIAVSILNGGRFGMAGALAGLMRCCVEKSAAFADARHQFDSRPIRNYGAVQEKLSKMAARQYICESIAFHLAGIMDLEAKGKDGEAEGDYQLEAAVCKVMASEFAWFVIDEAIQIHGGMGFMTDTGLERVMRDLRVFRIFEGTSEILKIFIALGGCQYIGVYLKNLQRALKNPISNFELLKNDFFDQIKRTPISMFPPLSNTTTLPPPLNLILKRCESTLACLAHYFSATVRAYVLKNGIAIKNEPFTFDEFGLTRLAESASLIFATSVGLSRILTALNTTSNKWSDENWLTGLQHQASLVSLFCAEADEKVRMDLAAVIEHSIKKSPDKEGRFHDMKKVSDEIVKHGTIMGNHPLGF